MLFKGVIGVWILALTMILGQLMAKHLVPLRIPSRLHNLAMKGISLGGYSPQTSESDLIAVHILDPRCKCSGRVMEVLKADSHSAEHAILLLSKLEDSHYSDLLDKGYKLTYMDAEQVNEEFEVASVPWLIVMNRDQEVLYAGGYSRGVIRSAKDVILGEVIANIRQDKEIGSIESFGCVTSQLLTELFRN